MGSAEGNWLKESMEAYRVARAELDRISKLDREEISFFVDEMSEVLLDLKQAVINVDSSRAWRARQELRSLLSDLDDLLKGEEE